MCLGVGIYLQREAKGTVDFSVITGLKMLALLRGVLAGKQQARVNSWFDGGELGQP